MAWHDGSRIVRSALFLTCLAGPALAQTATPKVDDVAACRARQAELTAKAAAFQGDTTIKRLIDADLRRASKEANEGDGDECAEALDHAAKLLAGEV